MSQEDKSRYYQALKAEGVEFTKHYREYSTEELAAAYQQLQANKTPEQPTAGDEDEAPASFFGFAEPTPEPEPPKREREAPVRAADPTEMAGQRQNQLAEDEPLRTDPETGFIWYQEEVRKPAAPKPRGRRVLQYTDTGSSTETARSTRSCAVTAAEMPLSTTGRLTLMMASSASL